MTYVDRKLEREEPASELYEKLSVLPKRKNSKFQCSVCSTWASEPCFHYKMNTGPRRERICCSCFVRAG